MSFCTNCGSVLDEGAKFCKVCGAATSDDLQQQQQPVYQQPEYQQSSYQQQPVYQQPTYQQPEYQQPVYQQPVQPLKKEVKPKSNGLCTAGFVFSLLGVFLLGITSVFGLIFSFFGLISANKKKLRGKGKAVAGIILSLLMIAALLVTYFVFGNTLMDKYEELTGRTFPTRKVSVDFKDKIEGSSWVVVEDETCISFNSGDRTFKHYFSYSENSELYMTGRYELYNGSGAVKYLVGIDDGAYFEDAYDVRDLYDRDSRYYEKNLMALNCEYDGFVSDGEMRDDIDPVTERVYGFYVLVIRGDQVFDAIKMHNVDSGSDFTLIRADQYIDYMFAGEYDYMQPEAADTAG